MSTPECYQMNLNGEPVDFFNIAKIAGYPDEPLLHAVKKLLFAGKRGKKTKREDVAEAMQSCQRWLDMHRAASERGLEDAPIPYEVVDGLDEVKPVKQAENAIWEYFTGEQALERGYKKQTSTDDHLRSGYWFVVNPRYPWEKKCQYRRTKQPPSTETVNPTC